MDGDLIITTLQMREPPHVHATPPLRAAMLVPLNEPSVSFYRYLHDGVGRSWGWALLEDLKDDAVAEHLEDETVHIAILSVGGAPAGFYELSQPDNGTVELVHVGLMPHFMGRGLGRHLLSAAVEAAWNLEPEVVQVSTDSNEHPRGVLMYQWIGFTPVETRRVTDQSS